MAFNIQRRVPVRQIQTTKRAVPIEQIIAAESFNPVAQGIETSTAAVGQALLKRAELRRQGEQLAALSKLGGKDYSGLDLPTATQMAVSDAKSRAENYTPEQLLALQTGDPTAISSTFPNGVPPAAASYSSTASNREEARKLREIQMAALENEREKNRLEKRSKEKTEIVNKFNMDPGVRKIQASVDSAANVRELALSGNPIAANAIPTYMARASGEVGALSEADKIPFGGSAAILSRLQAALTQKATGQLSEDNRKFLIDLSDTMEASANKNLERRAKDVSSQYGQASDFLKPDEIYSTLRPIPMQKPQLITPKKVGRFQIEVE